MDTLHFTVSTGALKNIFAAKSYRFFNNGRINVFGVRSATVKPGAFNDVIGCFWFDLEKTLWDFMWYRGTTIPGLYYLNHPANVEGTAILVEGQYVESHVIDLHKGQYEALCQRKPMKFYRDNDLDGKYDLDPATIHEEIIGCNIHRANPEYESTLVDKWSAACQVMANPQGFKDFMFLARESEQLFGNMFDYTLLNEKDFLPS